MTDKSYLFYFDATETRRVLDEGLDKLEGLEDWNYLKSRGEVWAWCIYLISESFADILSMTHVRATTEAGGLVSLDLLLDTLSDKIKDDIALYIRSVSSHHKKHSGEYTELYLSAMHNVATTALLVASSLRLMTGLETPHWWGAEIATNPFYGVSVRIRMPADIEMKVLASG